MRILRKHDRKLSRLQVDHSMEDSHKKRHNFPFATVRKLEDDDRDFASFETKRFAECVWNRRRRKKQR